MMTHDLARAATEALARYAEELANASPEDEEGEEEYLDEGDTGWTDPRCGTNPCQCGQGSGVIIWPSD